MRFNRRQFFAVIAGALALPKAKQTMAQRNPFDRAIMTPSVDLLLEEMYPERSIREQEAMAQSYQENGHTFYALNFHPDILDSRPALLVDREFPLQPYGSWSGGILLKAQDHV